MKVLQINTTYNIGSTGRIMAGIDKVLVDAGIDSYCAFGYGNQIDDHHFRILTPLESKLHNLQSRITDSQGQHSTYRTNQLINYIDQVCPDIVHLHNLHGNYLDYKCLFKYLQHSHCKIVWTLHDCWPFTGHCAYFDMAGCEKWKVGCHDCPQLKAYPHSFWIDGSKRNYALKKDLFTSVSSRLTMIPVSDWLNGLLHESFFHDVNITTIHNGINIEKFKATKSLIQDKYVLGVAAAWTARKGLKDMLHLRELLSIDIKLVLIGLTKDQISEMPEGIIGVEKTASVHELAAYYSGAIVLFNPTYEDNYPTVNLESIACGTPVVTYKTGGSPEIVNICEQYGYVVNQGDVSAVVRYIKKKQNVPKLVHDDNSLRNFDEKICYTNYLNLYRTL